MRGTHCDSLVNFTRESRIVLTLVSMSSMFTSRSKYFWYSSLIRLLSSTDPLRSSSWNISLKIYSVFLQPILSCNFLTTFSNICYENLGKFSGQFFFVAVYPKFNFCLLLWNFLAIIDKMSDQFTQSCCWRKN